MTKTIEQERAEAAPTVRIPSVERGCSGKINLGRDYKRNAERLAKKHGKNYGVYQCPHCGCAHSTTKLENTSRYAQLLYVTTGVKNGK